MRCQKNGKQNEVIHVFKTEDASEMVSVLTGDDFKDWYVLVDTKGALENFAIAAAEFSDLCILPTKMSLGSLDPAIEFYKVMRERGVKTPTRLVFNEIHNFHKNSRTHQETFARIQQSGVPYFSTMIFQREVYRGLESGIGSFEALEMGVEAISGAKKNLGALLLEVAGVLNDGADHG